MNNDIGSVHEKAVAIFRELAGDQARELSIAVPAAQRSIKQALGKQFDPKTATEIAFHLTDWNSDAAFITALMLFPERFTPEEICDGVERFLIHVPNHLAAAAKQHGHPIEDIFETGIFDREAENTGSSH